MSEEKITTFEQFIEFLDKRKSSKQQANYQPTTIRTLLENGNICSKKKILGPLDYAKAPYFAIIVLRNSFWFIFNGILSLSSFSIVSSSFFSSCFRNLILIKTRIAFSCSLMVKGSQKMANYKPSLFFEDENKPVTLRK